MRHRCRNHGARRVGRGAPWALVVVASGVAAFLAGCSVYEASIRRELSRRELAQGNRVAALEHANRAVDLAPNAPSYLVRSVALAAFGHCDGAREDVDRAVLVGSVDRTAAERAIAASCLPDGSGVARPAASAASAGTGDAAAANSATGGVPVDLARQIVADEGGSEWLRDGHGGDIRKLAASLGVRRVDLNGDGQMEYLVTAGDALLCGSGGCSLWIYRQDGVSYVTLLDDLVLAAYIDKQRVELGPAQHGGYATIRLEDGTRLRFDGRVYKYIGSQQR